MSELLLNASSEMLLLLNAQSLNIVTANASAHSHLGYRPDTLTGMPISELECALSDMFFWDEMQANHTAREAQSSYRKADGTVLHVMKAVQRAGQHGEFFTIRARPMRSERPLETELAAVASHLTATLEATADGILLVDNAGTILNMNRRFSQLWQLPQALLDNRDDPGIVAFMGKRLISADAPALASSASGHALGLINESDEDTFEVQHLKDGRVFERSSHPAHDREHIIGRVFCYRDVTEQHRTQQELIAAHDNAKQASRAKGEFLAMMSHEIRTPMNGVLGVAELLAGTPLNAEQTHLVEMIHSSGKTLLAVINDILDYSKIEAGKMALEVIDFSPAALIEDVAQLFRIRPQDHGPELVCQVDGLLPPQLRGDPSRLRQILFNLIGNAFKFTEHGTITVRVSCAAIADLAGAMNLRFSVRDTGIGIAPDRQADVFNAFEQADTATTRRFGGTGLGLSICNRLTQLMGGTIGLSSVPGEGSEFWFTAQVALPAQTAPQVAHAVPESASLSPHLQILVVEDHPVNRVVMQAMLKRLGATQVVMVENGLEGVEAASAGHFDIILMDAQMPVMDGYEATRALRARGKTMPIVGVSAGAMEEERQAAIDAGMNGYVHKPISRAALRDAMLKALGLA